MASTMISASESSLIGENVLPSLGLIYSSAFELCSMKVVKNRILSEQDCGTGKSRASVHAKRKRGRRGRGEDTRGGECINEDGKGEVDSSFVWLHGD